jgi:hypothetical protein
VIETQRTAIRFVPVPRSAPFESFSRRNPLEKLRSPIHACGYHRQSSSAVRQKFYLVSLAWVSLLTPIAVLLSPKTNP